MLNGWTKPNNLLLKLEKILPNLSFGRVLKPAGPIKAFLIAIFLGLLIGWLSVFLSTSSFIIILAFLTFAAGFVDAKFGILLLIIALPLSPEIVLTPLPGLVQSSNAGVMLVTLNFGDVVLLAVFLGWLARMCLHHKMSLIRTPLNRLLLLYLLVAVLSLFGAFFTLPLGQFKICLLYLLKLAEVFMVFFIVVNNVKRVGQVEMYLGVFILVAFIVSLVGLIKYFGGYDIAMRAMFDSRMGFGGYLTIFLAINICLLFDKISQEKKILLVFLSFLFLFCLVLTQKRAVYLGLAGAIVFLGIYKDRRILKYALFSLPLILILGYQSFLSVFRETFTVAAGGVTRIGLTSYPWYIKFLEGIPISISIIHRFLRWGTSLQAFFSNPLLGSGFWSSSFKGFGLAHNIYLQVLAEMGLLGLLILFLVIRTVIRESFRLFKTENNILIRNFACGFLAGFVGILIQGFFEQSLYIFQMMANVWVMVGLIMIVRIFQKRERSYFLS